MSRAGWVATAVMLVAMMALAAHVVSQGMEGVRRAYHRTHVGIYAE